MNYEEFKEALQKEIQVAEYQNGVSIKEIVSNILPYIFNLSDYPEKPELTPENARKYISFSLLNKELNKALLEGCPYKEIHDMAAVPRWRISDEASFVVNNGVIRKLGMTREEILAVAQENTEGKDYICRKIEDVIKEIVLNGGLAGNFVNERQLTGYPQLYVISNSKMLDGSSAILSGRFMKKAAKQMGTDELYILPSSRHEVLALTSSTVYDPSMLNLIVMSVNREPGIMAKEDFLSDSVYKYNADTNILSVWDSKE